MSPRGMRYIELAMRLGLFLLAPCLWGQGYTLTKVVANFFDQRPDGLGAFNIVGGPVIEGRNVNFASFGQGGFVDSIWSASIGSPPRSCWT